MNRKIIFSKKSEKQINDIYNYVLSTSSDEDIAKKYINEMFDSIEILKKHAYVGKQLVLVDNIETAYRYVRYKDYLSFYRIEEDKVIIDWILNSKTDYVKEFIKEI